MFKTYEKKHFFTARRRPKRPKFGQGRFQEATFSILNFDLFFGSNFVSFCLPKCLPLGTLLASKSIKKWIRNRTAQEVAPRSPPERPRPSQDAPEPPRTPQDALRNPHDGPGCLQKAFPNHLAQQPFSGKTTTSKSSKDVEKVKKNIMFLHDGLSAESLVKTESPFATVGGWRRWSR